MKAIIVTRYHLSPSSAMKGTNEVAKSTTRFENWHSLKEIRKYGRILGKSEWKNGVSYSTVKGINSYEIFIEEAK